MRTSWLVGAAAAAMLLTGPVYADPTGGNSGTGTSGGNVTAPYTRTVMPSGMIPGDTTSNDPRQGRYYDETDQWLDPSGVKPGAPQTKDGGG